MRVTLHTPETIYALRHVPSWMLLASAAGMVNGFAFLTCQQFVSHVTGTVTRMGLEWQHVGMAVEYSSILASFVAGAIVAILVIQIRARRIGRARWATPLVFVAVILAGVGIAGRFGGLGPLPHMIASDEPPLILMLVLSFAMGLQNAAVASTTGLAVRTTHLSGPTTDFGMHLGTAVLATGAERREALRGAALRGGKIIAFMLGGVLSLPLTGRFGYLALIAPAIFILIAAGLSFAPDWSPSDYPYLRQVDGQPGRTVLPESPDGPRQ